MTKDAVPSSVSAGRNIFLRTVEARVQYIKANGLKLVDVPLNKMPDIMRKRETELIKSLGLDVSKPEDKAILRNRLASEFGLMR
jgi:hypothetical protein